MHLLAWARDGAVPGPETKKSVFRKKIGVYGQLFWVLWRSRRITSEHFGVPSAILSWNLVLTNCSSSFQQLVAEVEKKL